MPTSSFVEQLRAEAALSSTFEKGVRLAAGGSVAALEVRRGAFGDVVDVGGEVAGSGPSPYKVNVALDLERCELVDYGCTCMAAMSYQGMCKHEIALALSYLDAEDVEPTPLAARRRAQRTAAHATSAARAAAAPALPTSYQLKDLMDVLTAQRVNDAARSHRPAVGVAREIFEPVDFSVTLLPSRDSYSYADEAWCIKLKVVCGKTSYVVKNVASLVASCELGEHVSYGKNLAFSHVRSAFTERAWELVGILTGVVQSQQALFRSRWRYQGAGRGADIKELPVSSADIIRILDLYQGETITFDPEAYGSEKPRVLDVVEGDPVLRAALAQSPEGGYDLSLPHGQRCFAADDALYVLTAKAAHRCSGEYAARAAGFLTRLLPLRQSLHLAPADLADFCRTVLPQLRACCTLELPAGFEEAAPPEAEFSFKIGLADGVVSCEARVSYGEWSASLYEPRRAGQPARDIVAEYHAQDVVETYFSVWSEPAVGAAAPGSRAGTAPAEGAATRLAFDEDDDQMLYELLANGLADLQELGEVLLSERLRNVRVRPAPNLSVRATVTSGLLDVEVNASGLADADLAAYLASYKAHQRFVRLSGGDLMRVEGGIQAVDDLAQGLGVEPEELALGVGGLPANRTLFVDELLRRTEGVRLSRNAAFRAIVRDFDTYSDADFEVPASLAGTLRSYQVDGFRWLQTLGRFGFGGILADDMGLGKTLQMIAHILACKEGGEKEPTLVVCPASLVYNWMAELARFSPTLDAQAILGSKAARRSLIEQAGAHDVLVTSYDLMRRDVEELSEVAFARIVLDEAHYIKNARTQVARAAKCLNGREHFALTGTPVENRLAELWSIFDFLMPGILGSREEFAKRFEGPVEHGEASASRRLSCMVSPFILRRLKEDVLADLPDKTESVIYAQLTGEQDKLYRAAQDRLARQIDKEQPSEFKKNKLQVLAELTKLRQICCDPRLAFDGYGGGSAKLDACMELVRGALEGGHKVLLFSQFTSMLELVGARLGQEGVGHLVLTGSTSKEERSRLVRRFQDGEAPVFLISLKAGGVGLNLTAADVVVHYDPWWNVAAQNQATDRAHRIGQKNPVSVFKIIAKDTIEERILKMQEAKSDLADRVLGGRDMASTDLTREDFLALLGSGAGE